MNSLFSKREAVKVWVLSYDWDGEPKTRTYHFDDQDEAIGQRQDLLSHPRCRKAAIDLVTIPTR